MILIQTLNRITNDQMVVSMTLKIRKQQLLRNAPGSCGVERQASAKIFDFEPQFLAGQITGRSS